jgi:hypothetical protein
MRFLAPLALAWLLPTSAFAVGQGEASVSVGGGLAIEFQGESAVGAAAEIRLLRGLTDAWSARLGLQASLLPASDGRKAASVLSQAVGVTWAVDIVKLVPFLDLGLLVADVRGGGHEASQRLGVQAGLGVDYLVSRRTVVSLLGRVDFLPLRLAGSAHAPMPAVVSVVLHLGRTF